MTNEEKINVIRNRIVYWKALQMAATVLGQDYDSQAAQAQAKISELEADIAELEG